MQFNAFHEQTTCENNFSLFIRKTRLNLPPCYTFLLSPSHFQCMNQITTPKELQKTCEKQKKERAFKILKSDSEAVKCSAVKSNKEKHLPHIRTIKHMNAWTNRRNTTPPSAIPHSASHLFLSVNHSPPLCSLLAAGLNQIPINACRNGSH